MKADSEAGKEGRKRVQPATRENTKLEVRVANLELECVDALLISTLFVRHWSYRY